MCLERYLICEEFIFLSRALERTCLLLVFRSDTFIFIMLPPSFIGEDCIAALCFQVTLKLAFLKQVPNLPWHGPSIEVLRAERALLHFHFATCDALTAEVPFALLATHDVITRRDVDDAQTEAAFKVLDNSPI